LLQYQNTRGAGVQGWLPDGSGILVSTRFAETSQVHLVRQPLGMRRQITFFREPISGVAVRPGRNEFLFGKDSGGDEFTQIHRFDLATGRSEQLTSGRFIHRAFTWDEEGRRFAFLSNRRTGSDWDIYLADADNAAEARIILQRGGFWAPSSFSPDGTRLLVGRAVSANENFLHILDLATGELVDINPGKTGISYDGAVWARDGRSLFLSSDEGSEFSRLRRYDLATGEQQVLTADIPWDVGGLELSRDGRTLAFTSNENGLSRIWLLDVATGARREVVGLPSGLAGGLSFEPSGARLAFTHNSSVSPSDVFVVDVATGAAVRWTQSEVGGLDPATFRDAELVTWPTFDEVDGRRREISGFLVAPPGPGPFPVVIDIHGGPEAQHRPGFAPLYQFLVNELGVAVLSPNVRGSSGFGKTFLKLDNGPLREDSVRDIGALLDWMATQPRFDMDRVAVMGGSYGGYMVYASMIHFGERLRAGISVVGIADFVTFLERTEAYRRDLRRVEYGDERDPAMRAVFDRISPLRRVSEIRRPMMIAHGRNDPRVPVFEAEQMRDAIRANGGDVWYFLATDEGHGFAKKGNRDAYQEAVVLFLQQHLLDGR
jgi:dipeptidyl aminopeptidase/acylaminoacyl peptidase